jgi:hypothetical protein
LQVVVLYNDEHLPFTFNLDKASYDATPEVVAAAGGKVVLDITPTHGTIPPGGQVRGWHSRLGRGMCTKMKQLFSSCDRQ